MEELKHIVAAVQHLGGCVERVFAWGLLVIAITAVVIMLQGIARILLRGPRKPPAGMQIW